MHFETRRPLVPHTQHTQLPTFYSTAPPMHYTFFPFSLLLFISPSLWVHVSPPRIQLGVWGVLLGKFKKKTLKTCLFKNKKNIKERFFTSAVRI